MATTRDILFGFLLLVLPWLGLLLDAFVLGFNFLVSLAMLLWFSLGLLFYAAVTTEV